MKSETKASQSFFTLALTFFTVHEIDAAVRQEWMFIPLLKDLSASVGETAFIALHIPLLFLLFSMVTSGNRKIRSRSKFFFSILFICHSIAHFFLSGYCNFSFASFWPALFIYGAAAASIAYLVVLRFNPKTKGGDK